MNLNLWGKTLPSHKGRDLNPAKLNHTIRSGRLFCCFTRSFSLKANIESESDVESEKRNLNKLEKKCTW